MIPGFLRILLAPRSALRFGVRPLIVVLTVDATFKSNHPFLLAFCRILFGLIVADPQVFFVNFRMSQLWLLFLLLLLRPVVVSVAVPNQILKVGVLPPAAIVPPLFSSVVHLFVGVVPITAGFRLATLCIEHLKHLMRLWLFYTNQPYLLLLSWLSHIPYVPPPEPHVMVAFGWLRPYSSHSFVDRSDQYLVAPMVR